MHSIKNYIQLSQYERDLIATYLVSGLSHGNISKILGGDHRTISREIYRNSINNKLINDLVTKYLPSHAHTIALHRKHTSKTSNPQVPAVKHFVPDKLQHHWSPEQISGRLNSFATNKSVSTETIYKFIYDKKNGDLHIYEFLRKAYSKRSLIYNCKPTQPKRLVTPNKISIKHHSSSANNRKSLGRYESNLMEGLKASKYTASVTSDICSLLFMLINITKIAPVWSNINSCIIFRSVFFLKAKR